MSRIRLFIVSVLGLVAGSTPMSAQGQSVCWLRVQPAPQCRSYIVTEAAVEIPFLSTHTPPGPAGQILDFEEARTTLTLGGMKNLTPKHAVGGTLSWDFAHGWTAKPVRGEVRYRKWLPKAAMDFSGGFAREGINTPTGSGAIATGLTAGVGVDWRYIGADLRADVLRGDGRTVAAGYVGARATSAGAPAALLVFGAFLVAYVAAVGAS